MGTYRIELDEMIEALENVLNDIQGDFTKKDLLKVLEFVCDKECAKAEKRWEKLKQEAGFYGD